MRLKAKGFTLIELAIVIGISSFILLAMMRAYWVYVNEQAREKTEASMERIEANLLNFQLKFGRYPCPARIDLPPTDINYGKEAVGCNTATFDAVTTLGLKHPVEGERDTDSDGNGDPILVGMIPYRTIEPCIDDPIGEVCYRWPLEETYVFDGYGNRITYVVSQYLTNDTTYDKNAGAIDVQDEHKKSLLDPVASVHFALISHGPDGRGAFNDNGSLVDNDCVGHVVSGTYVPFTFSATKWDEKQNCDHDDGILLSGLRNDTKDDYYDDKIQYYKTELSTLWQRAGAGIMYNNNDGNVGIGDFDAASPPQEALHVKGDIQAKDVLADEICDVSGSDCFKPEFLGGPQKTDMTDGYQNTCANNDEAIIDLEFNEVKCAKVYATMAPSGAQSCDTANGEVAVGYSSATGLICEVLP